MRKLVEYKIPYTGLRLGRHDFSFKIGDKFLENFDNPEELRNTDVDLHVDLEKQSAMIILNFDFSGEGTVSCDRCGEDMEIDLEGEEKLIVKYGDESYVGQTDEILVISPAEHEIDISQSVYEFIQLAIPTRKVHAPGKCDPEVIRKLEELSTDKNNDEEPQDPRWAALRKYKNE